MLHPGADIAERLRRVAGLLDPGSNAEKIVIQEIPAAKEGDTQS
jgi:hypothetical protein